jgi:hypothetical protein
VLQIGFSTSKNFPGVFFHVYLFFLYAKSGFQDLFNSENFYAWGPTVSRSSHRARAHAVGITLHLYSMPRATATRRPASRVHDHFTTGSLHRPNLLHTTSYPTLLSRSPAAFPSAPLLNRLVGTTLQAPRPIVSIRRALCRWPELTILCHSSFFSAVQVSGRANDAGQASPRCLRLHSSTPPRVAAPSHLAVFPCHRTTLSSELHLPKTPKMGSLQPTPSFVE